MGAKHCLMCGKKLERHKGESKRDWEVRKYCSRACSGLRYEKKRALMNKLKHCAFCGKPLAIQKYGTYTYKKLKYCSRKCFYLANALLPRKSKKTKITIKNCLYYPRILIGDAECLRGEKLSCKTCRHFGRDSYSIAIDAWDRPEDLTFDI